MFAKQKFLALLTFACFCIGGIFSAQSAEFPKAGADCATLATQGCWTWYHDSRAVYYKGTKEKTYVGYFSSSSNPGAAAIASYDHAAGTIDTFYLKTNFGFDDHHTVAVHVRPDGRIMAFYSQHYGSALYQRISINPEDITSWGPEQTIFSGSCTYPNICQLSSEGANGNRLYMFFRGPSTTGGDAGMPYFITSDDGGTTWSTAIRFFFAGTENAGMRPYVKYVSNGKDKIYMLIERDNRNNNPARETYYMYYYNNGFYKMDGTLIKTVTDAKTTPVGVADVDIVFDPASPPDGLSGVKGTGWDNALDPGGNPVFVYDIFDGNGSNHRLYYYRWDGTTWNHSFLVNSGAPMTEGGAETGFAGGIILDHLNPNIVYLSTHVNGVFELERWVTPDSGKTWKYWQITANSAAKNCRPIVPRGYTSGKVGVVWNYGTYTTWGGPFSMDVKMYDFDSTKIAAPVTGVQGAVERRAPRTSGFNLLANGLSFILKSANSGTLRIYNVQGRLVADLTKNVRRMQSGNNVVSYKSLKLSHGAYIARMFDGMHDYSQNFIVPR